MRNLYAQHSPTHLHLIDTEAKPTELHSFTKYKMMMLNIVSSDRKFSLNSFGINTHMAIGRCPCRRQNIYAKYVHLYTHLHSCTIPGKLETNSTKKNIPKDTTLFSVGSNVNKVRLK